MIIRRKHWYPTDVFPRYISRQILDVLKKNYEFDNDCDEFGKKKEALANHLVKARKVRLFQRLKYILSDTGCLVAMIAILMSM